MSSRAFVLVFARRGRLKQLEDDFAPFFNVIMFNMVKRRRTKE